MIPLVSLFSEVLNDGFFCGLFSSGAVFVTGCSSGIGRTAALHLAQKGLVVFAGVRKQQDAEQLGKDSSNIVPVLVDVTKQAEVDQAATFVGEQLSQRKLSLLGVVNNSGISLPGMLELQDPARCRQVFEVNMFGALEVTRAFIPLLRKHRPADGRNTRVVFVSTGSALVTQVGNGSYGASKRGLESLADSFRMELEPWGIEVSSILPGPLRTPIHDVFKDPDFDSLFSVDDPSRHDAGVVTRYRKMFEGFVKMARFATYLMDSTVATDRVIEAALLDKVPKTRYDVGKVMYLARLGTYLPDRVVDFLNRT